MAVVPLPPPQIRHKAIDLPKCIITHTRVIFGMTAENTLLVNEDVYKFTLIHRYGKKYKEFYLTDKEYFQYKLNGFFDKFKTVVDNTQ